jgi:hypothetical protein
VIGAPATVPAASGRRARSQRGSAAVELPLVVGLVLIPFGVLILSVPTWIERQQAARDVAAEVGRSLVTSTDPGAVDPVALADRVAAGYGLPPGSVRVEVSGPLRRGEPVEVAATVAIPAVNLPGLGWRPAVQWTATHVERFPDLAEAP